jgi:hypothetical protein
MTDPELETAWHLDRLGRHGEAETRTRAVLAVRPDDEWGLRLLSIALAGQQTSTAVVYGAGARSSGVSRTAPPASDWWWEHY